MSGEGILPVQDPTREARSRIRRGTVVCPVCDSAATIHGSERVTPLVKTLWCRCTNLMCGMTWRMQLAFEYVVSPSAIARPDLELPPAPVELHRHTGEVGLQSQTGPPN